MDNGKILVCENKFLKFKLIIKNEKEALEKHCERQVYSKRPKSCGKCPDHRYVTIKEIPELIKKQYKTIV